MAIRNNVQAGYYAAIRENSEGRFLLPCELGADVSHVQELAQRTEEHCGGDSWAKANPVVDIRKVEIHIMENDK